ncbi:hypothetical protein APQ14_19590 [Vibrio toranzoniae]|uniref:Uncharacterized protein n=1 Tax=Vibrio toranzoniae TaxID=1194427 RepID=A0A109D576_9VIBR|nr:hypothetical protein [Vibrio toranzoniae]KWT98941.1 hypothetical protein APQ14_19590 [Vibrio toranzoniae]SBS38279.1 hypothetical protein VTO7225_02987 [Vibrio toranzoniae]
MVQWVIDNKEWVFSGIGVSITTLIFSLFIRRKKKETTIIENFQVGGENSTNYQSKGDMYFGGKDVQKRK